jgi:nitrous oxide reductase accessory protein NosL
MKGGMGLQETAPFSTIEGANAFVAKHGGEVVNWRGIPKGYVIIDADSSGADISNHPSTHDRHDGVGHGHKGS